MLDTLLIIIEQALLHIPLMMGAYISFSLLKVPDLSIESAYIVGAILGSSTLVTLENLPTGILILSIILISFCGGALVGTVSSILTQKAQFPHLLSSIITFGLFHGINQFISAAYVSLSKANNPLTLFNNIPQHPELPMLIMISISIIILIGMVFKTQLGYSYAAYGNNPQFFKNYGTSTAYIFITGIILANGLAGISGYLFAQSNGFLELNMGLGKALLCITALILGKGIMHTKKPFSILVPLIGTTTYFALQQILLKVGFNLKYFTAIQALLILCILLHTYRRQAFNNNLGI